MVDSTVMSLPAIPMPDALNHPQHARPRPTRAWMAKLHKAARYAGYAAEMLPAMILPICPNRSAARELRAGDCVARIYRHFPNEPAFLSDWEKLSLAVPGATTFQSPAWQRAISRFGDSLGSLRLLSAYRGGQLIGVMQLQACLGGRWIAPGRMTTDYLEPLLHPDHAPQALDAMLSLASPLGMRSLLIDPISPDTPTLRLFASVGQRHGYDFRTEHASTATMIPLADSWDEHLKTLSSHTRKELRRKVRKADEKGGGRFITADTPLAAGYALNDVLNLMEEAGGPKGRKVRWLFRQHFTAAGALIETGRLRVYQLHIDQHLAAGVIALPNKNHQILWCGAIDRALHQWSPGIVLFAKIFEQAIARGEKRIDLLRGQYPYKYTFGAVDRPLLRMILTRSH